MAPQQSLLGYFSMLLIHKESERNKERRWWCDAGKPGTTIISESGWREAVTGSIFGCPFTLAPPSRRLDERPLIQRRGKKKWESKERYESQSCIPKCKKEAVNSREALYNSGWPEAWVVQGGLDAPPLYPPLRVWAQVKELSSAPDRLRLADKDKASHQP